MSISFGGWGLSADASTPLPLPSPVQGITITAKEGQTRVGDLLPYQLDQGPATHVDSKTGGIGKGFSFLKNGGRYYFIPLIAGEIQVPALPLLDDNETLVSRSDPFSIKVESSIPEAERQNPEPAPAIGPMDLPFPAWLQSLVGFGVLVLVGGIVYLIYRVIKKRATRILKKILPIQPADVIALEALTQLEKKGLFAPGRHKALHFGISEIVKTYLGARFSFDATESTTAEMLESLKAKQGLQGLSQERVEEVTQLFAVLDLVKFTDHVPSLDLSRAQYEFAKKIVLMSREVKVEVR
jgi:hypothetical protein